MKQKRTFTKTKLCCSRQEIQRIDESLRRLGVTAKAFQSTKQKQQKK